MTFIVAAQTDIGLTKSVNQDSYLMRTFQTSSGDVALAVVCDGMGGLSGGEIASASVTKAFARWSENELPYLIAENTLKQKLKPQWIELARRQNRLLMQYGRDQHLKGGLGTTVTALLLTQTEGYILQVGDSRAYELSDEFKLLTEDQTLAAREIAAGRMTPEQAALSPDGNVLLQCVGSSPDLAPVFFAVSSKSNASYLLCSDGFRHLITSDEIWQYCNPQTLTDQIAMDQSARALIELNKTRQERDNITALLIKTHT